MRIYFIGLIIFALIGAGAYVMKLQRDNTVLKENAVKLESAISEQKQVIENQKKDFAEILEANKKINQLVNNLKKDLDDLDKRFNKGERDIGKLALERTGAIERIINKGSENAKRCIEIASGSPLTEQEKNATKKSEINPECPSSKSSITLLITFLTNCSSIKQLSIFKEEVKRQELNLDRPTPLQLEQIKWIIITSENADEVFKKMEEQGLDPVLFGLTDNDYQLIAKNFAQIRNQLKITNDILDKYKDYYEPKKEEKK
jgi:hypothetical protein